MRYLGEDLEFTAEPWCKPSVSGVVIGTLDPGVVIKCDECKKQHAMQTIDAAGKVKYTRSMTRIEKDIEDLHRMVENMWDEVKNSKTKEERDRYVIGYMILANALWDMMKL